MRVCFAGGRNFCPSRHLARSLLQHFAQRTPAYVNTLRLRAATWMNRIRAAGAGCLSQTDTEILPRRSATIRGCEHTNIFNLSIQQTSLSGASCSGHSGFKPLVQGPTTLIQGACRFPQHVKPNSPSETYNIPRPLPSSSYKIQNSRDHSTLHYVVEEGSLNKPTINQPFTADSWFWSDVMTP